MRQGGIDLVVSDVKMPDIDGLDMLREIKAVSPSPHVITITAFGSIDTAIRAVKLGAFDYITKPFEVDQLILSVDKALAERALRSEVARLRDEVQRSYRWGTSSAARRRCRRCSGSSGASPARRRRCSSPASRAPARSWSPRRSTSTARASERPFVPLNCAAIPDTLLESELFGYKRGAFTDARADKSGLFVEADGGTLFLDEIAELSPALQAKLLRVLQEREIRPLGAARSEQIDVRVVAATNKDLETRLGDGTFREDLYYRLNVVHIHLPPLRDRAGGHPRPRRALPGAQRRQGREGGPRISRDGAQGAARLRLARQRARAGERRRARGGADRERAGAVGGPAADCARAARDQRGRPLARRWRAA